MDWTLTPTRWKPPSKICRTKNPEGSEDLLLLCSLKLTDYFVFSPEITMAKVNLSGMTVEALMVLRKRVDEMLHDRRGEIEKQLERMGRAIAVVGGARVVRGGRSALKGRKVPAKYRGPSGETWAGRGARSRHGAPDRSTQKMPFRTRRSSTRGTPRDLFGSIGLMAAHSWSLSS